MTSRRVRGPWRRVAYVVALILIVGAVGTGFVVVNETTTTTTSTSTTTTTVPPETAQAGWSVESRSARGVMVDFRNVTVNGAVFRVVRFRARTTLLRWHVGSIDPLRHALAPLDAGPSIDWASEGRAGVVAVFNGGFKQAAKAGGAVVDGVTLTPLVKGDMTVVLDRAGHWAMGVWGGVNFPPLGFAPISYRQNLGPMVLAHHLTVAVASTNFTPWGSPLNNRPLTARTGLGVDGAGNLLYVATMTPVLAPTLAHALVTSGAVTGMELDINPYWPILGGSRSPVHAFGGLFNLQLPYGPHPPSIYETGWQRDFFVVLAEPSSWTCHWQSAGVRAGPARAQPQPLALVGAGCPGVSTTTSTTSTNVATTGAATTSRPAGT